MGWFRRTVTVILIDDATGAPFAPPPADLPKSFELDTTVHLGGIDWSVVHAEPRTRADYTSSGNWSCGSGESRKSIRATSCSAFLHYAFGVRTLQTRDSETPLDRIDYEAIAPSGGSH